MPDDLLERRVVIEQEPFPECAVFNRVCDQTQRRFRSCGFHLAGATQQRDFEVARFVMSPVVLAGLTSFGGESKPLLNTAAQHEKSSPEAVAAIVTVVSVPPTLTRDQNIRPATVLSVPAFWAV